MRCFPSPERTFSIVNMTETMKRTIPVFIVRIKLNTRENAKAYYIVGAQYIVGDWDLFLLPCFELCQQVWVGNSWFPV